MDRRPRSLSLPLPAGENGRRHRLAARQAPQHRCHRRRRGQRPTAPGFVVGVVVVGPCAMEEPHLHSVVVALPPTAAAAAAAAAVVKTAPAVAVAATPPLERVVPRAPGEVFAVLRGACRHRHRRRSRSREDCGQPSVLRHLARRLLARVGQAARRVAAWPRRWQLDQLPVMGTAKRAAVRRRRRRRQGADPFAD